MAGRIRVSPAGGWLRDQQGDACEDGHPVQGPASVQGGRACRRCGGWPLSGEAGGLHPQLHGQPGQEPLPPVHPYASRGQGAGQELPVLGRQHRAGGTLVIFSLSVCLSGTPSSCG